MRVPGESVSVAALLADPSTLVYGIGNSGRQDDGLGWAFVDRLEAGPDRCAAVLHRAYQLHLEDADLINRFETVLFVDATKESAVASYRLTRPEAKFDFSFASHAMSVPSVLATAVQCFGCCPDAYLLAIRGYEWELCTGLTTPAAANLTQSLTLTRETVSLD